MDLAESNALHAYDLDDTLFSHRPRAVKVYVRDHAGKKVASLATHEFNKHKLKPGQSYDFSEFRSSKAFGRSARPIKPMIAHLRNMQKRGQKTEILTARSDMDDRDEFGRKLAKHGIDISKTHVRRSGNIQGTSTGDRKRKVLSDLIYKHGYKEVHLYDDDLGNHAHFSKLKDEHPGVKLYSHVVQHNDHTGKTKLTTIKH